MTTAYTSILGLALPVTGELQGTWGQTVNDEITSLAESAIAGTTQLTSDADVTLSTTDGVANQARQMILRCTGARSSLKTIVAPARSKTYFVINATSGGFGVRIAGPGPTTGVTVAPGKSTWVAWSGSDFVEIAPAVATNLSAGTTGAIPYQTAANVTTFLGIGTAGQVLQVNAGATAPEWVSSSGTGNVARVTSPSFTTPSLGAATALSINSLTITTSTGTFTLANGKTLTVNNSLTLNGTDATTMTFPSTSATIARTDAAQTFTGVQTFGSNPIFNAGNANGLLYLNASKAATSSPTITSDGTNIQLGAQGDMRFADADSSNWVAFQAPATVASDVTWTLPAADGTTNQSLVTNGSGSLSWASVNSPGGSNTQVQFNDSGQFGGDADFTWDKTGNILTITGEIRGTTITENTQPVVVQADIGTAPNEIPLNQYLGALAYEDSEFVAPQTGTGITAGTGTLVGTSYSVQGTVKVMRVLIDITGLNSGGTAGDIIGVDGTANPCYIAQIPSTFTILGGRMTCLETPAGGDTDIDLYSATEGTGVEDQAITALTETQIINAGTQSVGTVTYFAADPAANQYFYLVGQSTSNATYTAGRFLIEVFGV